MNLRKTAFILVLSILFLELFLRIAFRYTNRGPWIKNLVVGNYDYQNEFNLNTRYIPSPLLGHEPNPYFVDENGKKIHNSMGFRGKEIAPVKPPGVYRIACFGGSSTYDDKINENDLTYPVLLEKSLNARKNNLSKMGISRVEVINAGAGSYTSTENLLTLYLKVMPLDVDLFVFYQGYNDIHVHTFSNIAPILRTYKKDWSYPRISRFSFTLSKISILYRTLYKKIVFTDGYKEGRYEFGLLGYITKCPWPDRKTKKENFEKNKAFILRRNLDALVKIIGNPEKILFLGQAVGVEPKGETIYPWRTPEYKGWMEYTGSVVRNAAKRHHVHYFDLNKKIPVTEEYFLDLIHTNEKGNAIKSRLISDYIFKIMLGK